MRFIAAASAILCIAAVARAQRDHWTEHLRANVEIVAVEPFPPRSEGLSFSCGRATIDWPVHARVLSVAEGDWAEPEITILWDACGRSYEDLSALVGRRFSLRLRRYMHASDLTRPVERQPRWYAWGTPTELE